MYRPWVYHLLLTSFVVVTFLFVGAVLFPAVVFAEAASPGTIPDMAGFWEAIGAAHWPLAVGIGLTLLVWIVRTFVKHKLPKKALPWVTLALAVVGTSGTRMIQAIGDDIAWWQGMVQGILEGMTVGFAAIGWWDTKQTVKKSEPKE